MDLCSIGGTPQYRATGLQYHRFVLQFSTMAEFQAHSGFGPGYAGSRWCQA